MSNATAMLENGGVVIGNGGAVFDVPQKATGVQATLETLGLVSENGIRTAPKTPYPGEIRIWHEDGKTGEARYLPLAACEAMTRERDTTFKVLEAAREEREKYRVVWEAAGEEGGRLRDALVDEKVRADGLEDDRDLARAQCGEAWGKAKALDAGNLRLRDDLDTMVLQLDAVRQQRDRGAAEVTKLTAKCTRLAEKLSDAVSQAEHAEERREDAVSRAEHAEERREAAAYDLTAALKKIAAFERAAAQCYRGTLGRLGWLTPMAALRQLFLVAGLGGKGGEN